jgi:hypothetical protein
MKELKMLKNLTVDNVIDKGKLMDTIILRIIAKLTTLCDKEFVCMDWHLIL